MPLIFPTGRRSDLHGTLNERVAEEKPPKRLKRFSQKNDVNQHSSILRKSKSLVIKQNCVDLRFLSAEFGCNLRIP